MTARMARAAFSIRPTSTCGSRSAPTTTTISRRRLPRCPSASAARRYGTTRFGTAPLWDAGLKTRRCSTKSNWEPVGGYGFALAWQVQITVGSEVAPDIELQSIDLTYEIGSVIVG